ncbi:MAG: hypothetical protein HYX21_03690 [Candidatus Yanofskybacteria bacterium]|nr:hypothetical protein [Candidatus Yanofskybacteria bacterium]
MRVRVLKELFTTRLRQRIAPKKVEKGMIFEVKMQVSNGYYLDLGNLGLTEDWGFAFKDEVEEVEEVDKRKLTALMTVVELFIVKHHQGSVLLDEPSFQLFELAKRIYRTKEDDEKSLQEVLTELANFKK